MEMPAPAYTCCTVYDGDFPTRMYRNVTVGPPWELPSRSVLADPETVSLAAVAAEYCSEKLREADAVICT